MNSMSNRGPAHVVDEPSAPLHGNDCTPHNVSSAARRPVLEARAISKTFHNAGGTVDALSNVSLSAEAGEFVSIIGPSGCGKSTLLEILAGLQPPSSGTVVIDGEQPNGAASAVGYMAQKDLLLPWRTVLDNTILALEMAGVRRKHARRKAAAWFPRFGLDGFEHHYPATLSGGMRQRASLLRTFLSGRDILVLDEPFGALDALTRAGLQQWLLSIQDEFQKTILLVTHDVDEALYLSDRVYVMSSRPGSISHALDVPIERPRRYQHVVTSPEFAVMKRALLEALQPRPPETRS